MKQHIVLPNWQWLKQVKNSRCQRRVRGTGRSEVRCGELPSGWCKLEFIPKKESERSVNVFDRSLVWNADACHRGLMMYVTSVPGRGTRLTTVQGDSALAAFMVRYVIYRKLLSTYGVMSFAI